MIQRDFSQSLPNPCSSIWTPHKELKWFQPLELVLARPFVLSPNTESSLGGNGEISLKSILSDFYYSTQWFMVWFWKLESLKCFVWFQLGQNAFIWCGNREGLSHPEKLIRYMAEMTKKNWICICPESSLSLATFQNQGKGCGHSLEWCLLKGTHQLLIHH